MTSPARRSEAALYLTLIPGSAATIFTIVWFNRMWGGDIEYQAHMLIGAATSILATMFFVIAAIRSPFTSGIRRLLVVVQFSLGWLVPLGAVLCLNDEVGAGILNSLLVFCGLWTLGLAATIAIITGVVSAYGARPLRDLADRPRASR